MARPNRISTTGSTRCVGDFSPTPSSRTTRSRSTSRLLIALALLFTNASACAAILTSANRGDHRVLRRWQLEGDPRGLAIDDDGTVYVGLAGPQAVVAINGETGDVIRRVVLDSDEIASTKEFVSLRIDRSQHRLVIAQGRDESVSILALPDLGVLREITLEGEVIRDALPDPTGRYLYILGSRAVHVFDADGEREIRRIRDIEPEAIATSSRGDVLAVVGREDFGNAVATSVALWDTSSLKEVTRVPLQTDAHVETALFAASDRAIVFFARNFVAEKSLTNRGGGSLESAEKGNMRMSFAFGDLVSNEMICLPDESGPQIATSGPTPDIVFFGEKRCGIQGAFTASERRVATVSVYGIHAWAIEYHRATNEIYATDPSGYLTVYKVPKTKRK